MVYLNLYFLKYSSRATKATINTFAYLSISLTSITRLLTYLGSVCERGGGLRTLPAGRTQPLHVLRVQRVGGRRAQHGYAGRALVDSADALQDLSNVMLYVYKQSYICKTPPPPVE